MTQRPSCLAALLVIGAGAVLLSPLISSQQVNAHAGGLDSQGCHNDNVAKEYHCHQGPLAGKIFRTKAEGALAFSLITSGSEAPKAPPKVGEPYDRSLYKHWIDADGDCQNTRQEVLLAESVVPATLDSKGCNVVSGMWYDPYIGAIITDPASLDVDHFIPLAEVHRSGGQFWDAKKRQDYANDLSDSATLIAVSSSANRSKSDLGPDQWMPINKEFRCQYVVTWLQVKRKWGLEIDGHEQSAINATIDSCKR